MLSGQTVKISTSAWPGSLGDGRRRTVSPQATLAASPIRNRSRQPDYLAPEQARDATGRTFARTSTAWAARCTIAYPAAAVPGRHDGGQIVRHQTQPAGTGVQPADAPPGLAGILAQLLAKDPARPYATPAEARQRPRPFHRASRRLTTARPAPAAGRPAVALPDSIRDPHSPSPAQAGVNPPLPHCQPSDCGSCEQLQRAPSRDGQTAQLLARTCARNAPLRTHQGENFAAASRRWQDAGRGLRGPRPAQQSWVGSKSTTGPRGVNSAAGGNTACAVSPSSATGTLLASAIRREFKSVPALDDPVVHANARRRCPGGV